MLPAIRDASTWRSVRLLFLGSGLMFLTTIALGVLNIVTDEISRGQLLAHLHSGSIGWVTLSIVAITLWAFTGGRDVDQTVANIAALIAGIGLLSVAGYITAFGLVFNGVTAAWMLPLFGIPAGLVIVATFAFAVVQRDRLDVVTGGHILLIGALAVASLGALMGILIGLSHAGIVHAFTSTGDVVGSHAGPMDMYLALAFGAIAEFLLMPRRPYTKGALWQTIIGAASGGVAWFALYMGIGPMVPLALLLFLVAYIIHFVRVGRHAFTQIKRPAIFFGGIGFPLYIVFFVVLVAQYFSQGELPPHVLGVIFVHVTFVGMATNWLLAAHGSFTTPQPGRTLGAWLLNIGLLAFIAGEVADVKDGAWIMAAGALVYLASVMRGQWIAGSQQRVS